MTSRTFRTVRSFLTTPRRDSASTACRWALTLLATLMASGAIADKRCASAEVAGAAWECRWAEEPITLDGEDSEPAWKAAQVLDRFTLPWLGEKGRPARTATVARLLWDREALYFHAEMEDTDLYADVNEHDGETWNNDVFELFFKPADDGPGYYEFQVNAAGAVTDVFLPRRGAGGFRRFRGDGDFHVEAKVRRRGTLNHWQDRDVGWSVEGRIPWRDFLRTGGRPEPGTCWKFALCRYDFSVDFEGPDLSTCAPLTVPSFHRFEDYATLRFVGPRGQNTSRPYGIDRRVALPGSRVVGSPDPPPPYRVEPAYPKLKLTYPVAVAHQPGSDRLLLIVQPRPYAPTRVVRAVDDPDAERVELLLDLPDTAYDVAFHPDFSRNGYLYVGSNGPHAGAPRKTRVTRYAMDRTPPYALDPKSATVIIDWPSDGHNGGALGFGPDGMLYVTSGDGTSDSDAHDVGQDLSRLTSKVLRIDVDHPDPGRAYAVPPDNPFVGVTGARPETWAYGLRNPWRLAVDRRTGRVWVGNNGQDLWEQVYLVRRGENYGWSVREGGHPFYPGRKTGPTPITPPTVEHPHSEARSLTGGFVYDGSRLPELRGVYLYGDYSTGKVWGVRHDGSRVTWHEALADTHLQITGFGADPRGEVLICDHRGDGSGGLYTLVPTPRGPPRPDFPRRLSETGLFRSVPGHVVEPALIPYSVNAPLWSDGASKVRYLALPGVDSRIDFTRDRGWNFPDGTVLVKSFALETAAGGHPSRRWVETRLLTRQDGEWAGYSYAWGDDQVDATLVDARGTDRHFLVNDPHTPEGVREQTWHYPGRIECMACHTRAANFVLGLCEEQMNKDHDYGPVVDNQLRTFEHLNVFRVDWAKETEAAAREEARGLPEGQVNAVPGRQTSARLQAPPRPSSLLSFPPEKYRRLVDPYDARNDLLARVKSYLHGNCAHCHVLAGGGNALMELGFTTPLGKMRVVGVKPLHHTFGLTDARLVAPGQPGRSVLLHRVALLGEGRMPPLASSVVDRDAVALLHDWIEQLPPAP